MSDSDAWSLYWQADRLDSCIASSRPEDEKELREFWQQATSGLRKGDAALDLACGNGSVALTVAAANPGVDIVAVDLADIDPLRYLSERPELQRIRFLGATNIESTPFPDGDFQFACSQFGIEYADLNRVAAELSRILVQSGRFEFLCHHNDSEILRSNRADAVELQELLRDAGLLKLLDDFLSGRSSFETLDTAAQKLLASDQRKTQRITGQAWDAIAQILRLQQTSPPAAKAAFADMATRMRAEGERLAQLDRAALSEHDLQQFISMLRNQGLVVSIAEAFYLGVGDAPALLAWRVSGYKSPS